MILIWEKILLLFVYLGNEPSSSSNLDLTIKRVKIKYNNVSMNKLINLRLELVYLILYV